MLSVKADMTTAWYAIIPGLSQTLCFVSPDEPGVFVLKMVIQVLISLSRWLSIVSRQLQLSSRSDWRLWVDAADAKKALLL